MYITPVLAATQSKTPSCQPAARPSRTHLAFCNPNLEIPLFNRVCMAIKRSEKAQKTAWAALGIFRPPAVSEVGAGASLLPNAISRSRDLWIFSGW
jgi:hypothetical protein